MSIPVQVSTNDPSLSGFNGQAVYLYSVYDALYTIATDGNVVPQLATTDDVSADGLSHKIGIRKDVKFHDGTALTAKDVKFSLDRSMDPNRTVPRLSDIQTIKSVDVVDDYTVVINLKNPNPVLHNDLTTLPARIVPKDYVEKVGDSGFNSKPVGSGPFKFDSESAGQWVKVVANDSYWGDKPKLSSVTFRTVVDAASQQSQLQSGQIDAIYAAGITQANTLAGSGFKVDAIKNGEIFFLQTRFDDKFPQLKDPKVREAINYAIDRKAIVDSIYKGYGAQIGTLSGPGTLGNPADIPLFPYDPEKAKALLKEANYDTNTKVGFSVPRGRFAGAEDAAQVIVSDLAKVGIKVELQILDYAEWLKQLTAAAESPLPSLNYVNAAGGKSDPVGILEAYLRCGRKSSRICDKTADSLMDKVQAAAGDARVTALQELLHYYHDNPTTIPLWELNMLIVSKKTVSIPGIKGSIILDLAHATNQ